MLLVVEPVVGVFLVQAVDLPCGEGYADEGDEKVGLGGCRCDDHEEGGEVDAEHLAA